MALPIKLEELMKLTMKGIKPEDINHVNVRMESDKFICVREASGNLSIVEMSSASMAPERKPMKAESVIMNPVAKVLALSAKVGPKTTLQIFNMEMRTKMKAYG
jgi:clathrin heavy chain